MADLVKVAPDTKTLISQDGLGPNDRVTGLGEGRVTGLGEQRTTT